jgi:hypothetical protein
MRRAPQLPLSVPYLDTRTRHPTLLPSTGRIVPAKACRKQHTVFISLQLVAARYKSGLQTVERFRIHFWESGDHGA